MNRYIYYPNSVITSQSLNLIQQSALQADADIWLALFGSTASSWGLAATPGAGLSINLSQGGCSLPTQIDSGGVAGFLVNTTPVIKTASTTGVTNITGFTSPAAGQSTVYLIEVSLSQTDSSPVILNYGNRVSNTVTYYAGSSSVNTTRTLTPTFQLKAGSTANTGQAVAPAADAGWLPLYTITVNGGSTSISAANIAVAAGSNFVSNILVTASQLSAYLTTTSASGLYVPLTQLSTSAGATTVALRDPSGNLTANYFHGIADNATNAQNAVNAQNATNATNAANAQSANTAVTAASANNAAALNGLTSAAAGTPNTLVARDASGNITTPTFIGALNGNASASLAVILNGTSYPGSIATAPTTTALRDSSGNLSAQQFNGVATSSEYGDLAERFEASEALQVGDVVQIGGDKEITLATDCYVGVISNRPGLKMNSNAGDDDTHPYVAYTGRVPVAIIGPILKGDPIGLSDQAGVACHAADGSCFGFALEDKTSDDIALVECVIR